MNLSSTSDNRAASRAVRRHAYAPRHPADLLTGCRVTGTGDGWAEATMPMPELPVGEDIPLGWMGTLADVSTAQALTRRLPKGHGIRTVNLRLDAVADIPDAGALASGHGEMVSLDEHSGLCTATLRGPAGDTFAVCTARFMVVPEEPAKMAPRPSETTPIDLGPQSMAEIFGIQGSTTTDRASTLIAHPSTFICNHFGMVHGGLHVGMVDQAMRSVVHPTDSAPIPRLLDIAVTYHRPISVSAERVLRLRAAVERRGRRLTAVTAAVESESGRLLTSAHGTFLTVSEE